MQSNCFSLITLKLSRYVGNFALSVTYFSVACGVQNDSYNYT